MYFIYASLAVGFNYCCEALLCILRIRCKCIYSTSLKAVDFIEFCILKTQRRNCF